MAKKLVLIVDDEPDIRLLVHRILSPEYNVIEAQGGREAISLTHSQKPDLILLDIVMPEIDGYTTCVTLKQDSQTKNIPIFMLTGLGFDLNKMLGQDIGTDGYITKPFKVEELLEIINNYFAKGIKP
jgi:DNA-binding response OmpR family regulator